MALQPVKSISHEDALRNVKRRFVVDPLLQPRVKVSGLEAAGATEIGWHRGHQAGIHSAYLTLKEAHPEAAKDLLKAFHMRTDGSR